MTLPLLAVDGLKTHFFTHAGVVRAVDGVSFTLEKGQVLGLVGESGSGKSVTGFSLLGLIDQPGRIVAGSVKLEGRELVNLPQDQLRNLRGQRIAMIFQDPATTLNPLLTIGDQMLLALRAHAASRRTQARRRCSELLTRVGIPDAESRLNAYPHQFSGGMRQRVAIAIALLHSPDIIIADEPTTALDVSIQAQIINEVRQLVRDSGSALIWISHDLATVSTLADELLVMYAGRIVETGPTAAVLRHPYHPYTQGLINSLPSSSQPGQLLAQIPGSTPSMLQLSDGCAFAPRCDFCTDSCEQMPILAGMNGHQQRRWRCHHPLLGSDE